MIGNRDPEDYFKDVDPEKEHRKRNSNIPRSLMTAEWTDYHIDNCGNGKTLPDYVKESRREALVSCRRYAKRIPEICKNYTGDSLLILGGSGTGKSTLGALSMKEAIDANASVVYYSDFSDLSLRLQGLWSDADLAAVRSEHTDPAFLMIDEVNEDCFPDKKADIIRQNLATIIKNRYNEKLPTIITSSIMTKEGLEKALGSASYNTLTKGDAYQIISILGARDEDKEIQIDFPKCNIKLKVLKKEIERFMEQQKEDIDKYNNEKKYGRPPKMPKRFNSEICDSQELVQMIKKGML
jgi:DNA replication protein DnaC